ncbi:hypothetical protein OHS33_38915 (plasmid) [Streptomyces sp. NBC_00536]|uniref:hypothetical protein n=1 Tax=Streptomyces sp. NBC_00536 TaxID=2975769 RepID=UPI002E81D97C|nr:hypothetical protein [Streptomyces sp. NBC_00536]WUC84330.1 hypothetical protein OHS33_38915 [Streptomyces sp. NBC_00536]
MPITIKGSPEFEAKLLALVAEHLDGLTIEQHAEWTVERAAAFHRLATPTARTLINDVLAGGGYRAAADLRDMGRDLAGPSIALTKTLTAGARDGLWPANMPAPITPEYDREKPSHKKVQGYRMDPALVPLFTTATEA